MSWINPKIDWITGDVPGAGDFNRIEGNIFLPRMQVFLENGFFVALDGIVKYWVSMCGGGGGGAVASFGSGNNIGGGGGAAYYRKKVVVIPGETIPIAVGVAGAAGASGGTSSFGSYLSCPGGRGASSSNFGAPGGAGGEPGISLQGGNCLLGIGATNNNIDVGIVNPAGGYGAGGCGTNSPYARGTNGIVIVEW